MSIGKTRKQMLLNEEEFFTTPDMGEYLDNNLIFLNVFYQLMNKIVLH